MTPQTEFYKLGEAQKHHFYSKLIFFLFEQELQFLNDPTEHAFSIILYNLLQAILLQMQFDEKAFGEKFKQLDTNSDGRLQKDLIAELLRQFDLEQHRASIQSTFLKFYYYANRFQLSTSKLANLKSIEIDEDQEQQDEQNIQEDIADEASKYKLSLHEAQRYADFIQHKIKFEIWKKTCILLELQYYMTQKAKRNMFPLKDPGQEGKVNIIIGKQQESYNSSLNASLRKLPSNTNEPIMLIVKISTNNKQSSTKIGTFWKNIFEMITGMLQQEMPDAGQFLKTIKITTQETDTHFLLKVQSNNNEVNQLLKSFSDLGDNIFKTTLKLKLDISLDFNFDIGEFISNKQSNLYDFLTQNIRIRVKFQGSQYVTALKQLMIVNDGFSDLSYVNDDPFTLQLIALVNMQNVDLNLRFSNDFFGEKEQQSLIGLLGILSQLKQMIAEYQEGMPDVINLVKEILRFKIDVQIKAYDFSVNLALNIRNLDKLIFQKSILLEQGGEEMESMSEDKEKEDGNAQVNQNNSQDS